VTEDAAHRAAGQAVAALLEGAPIVSLAIDGIEIAWPDGPKGDQPRPEILSEIAIGLAGISAEQGFRFGRVRGGGCAVRNCFTAGQVEDFGEVNALIDEIDPTGADDVLFTAWRQAVDFVADCATWSAIESLAVEIQHGEISGSDVVKIVSGGEAT